MNHKTYKSLQIKCSKGETRVTIIILTEAGAVRFITWNCERKGEIREREQWSVTRFKWEHHICIKFLPLTVIYQSTLYAFPLTQNCPVTISAQMYPFKAGNQDESIMSNRCRALSCAVSLSFLFSFYFFGLFCLFVYNFRGFTLELCSYVVYLNVQRHITGTVIPARTI